MELPGVLPSGTVSSQRAIAKALKLSQRSGSRPRIMGAYGVLMNQVCG
jgi:hypothetical protein